MNTDLLQSQAHQEFLRQTGWIVEDLGEGQVGYVMRLKFLPLVSVMGIPRVENPRALSFADQVARRYRSLVVRVSPKVIVGSKEAVLWEKELRAYGYVWDTSALVPPKTLVVDLGLSETDLLGQMKKKTRHNIRLSRRRGVTTKLVDGTTIATNVRYIDEFYTVYHQNCHRIGLRSWSRKEIEMMFNALRENLFVLYAYLNSGELGTVESYVVCGDTIVAHIIGSTAKGRHDYATNLVTWEGMLEGKRRGCRWYDFDGMRDERYRYTKDENWNGITRFKVGFGGEEVTYLGTYIKRLPFLKKARQCGFEG
jgi:lipid II:glycine glycyltransferase (peptidoglycan interpeptide bridge formation enzyme)